MSCSRTQHSDACEARTRGPSILSQALFHLATVLPCRAKYFIFYTPTIPLNTSYFPTQKYKIMYYTTSIFHFIIAILHFFTNVILLLPVQ